MIPDLHHGLHPTTQKKKTKKTGVGGREESSVGKFASSRFGRIGHLVSWFFPRVFLLIVTCPQPRGYSFLQIRHGDMGIS
jgi:hypothetical protein